MITPVLVKPESMEGTGFLGAHASEIYRLEADDLYLVGTSEVALAAYHGNEILDLPADRPRPVRRLVVVLPPGGRLVRQGRARHHPGAPVRQGRDVLVLPDPSRRAAEHLRLLAWEEEMLAKVEVPYRVIDVAAGDLGTSAARKFDCEAWVPSQGRYRELTSTSNCTTFQARRLSVRYRDDDGKPQIAATLNGTAGHHPVAGGDPGEPPAAGRFGGRAQGAAAVPRWAGRA